MAVAVDERMLIERALSEAKEALRDRESVIAELKQARPAPGAPSPYHPLPVFPPSLYTLLLPLPVYSSSPVHRTVPRCADAAWAVCTCAACAELGQEALARGVRRDRMTGWLARG